MAVNAAMEDRWRAAGLGVGPRQGRFPVGAPVIMQRNDYERDLWNGDCGVILAARHAGAMSLQAVFARDGRFMSFPVETLVEDLQLGFALTVHKAQGSEFDAVAIILPEADMPLASRHILYTALTRARRSAVLVGQRRILFAALSRSAERMSGLGARLK
jgi:exodeoxyribonuclease V alpha subunit